MIEIIIGLLIGFGTTFFWEVQAKEAHDYREREKRDAAYYKTPKEDYKAVPYQPKIVRILTVTLLGGVVGFGFASFTVISAGHQGVQVTLGQVNMQTLGEGFHFVNPISNIYNVDVRVVKADLKNANAGTKDMQMVHTDIVVNYRLDGAKVARVYKEFGLELENKILLPAINESFKAVTAKYNSEELITKRAEVSDSIHQTIQEKVAKYGLIINETSLVNFGFSADYQAAIEQKVIATQQKLKAEQDLERIKVESDQRIAKAKGEAEAIRIQAQAIQQQGGKEYVELKRIERWDGKLPVYAMGNAVPMFNLKD